VVSEVVKNERSDYDGYGLNILRAESKESNLNQDREYDWKYEEDSGYSGVLEELELPKKVRMNGSMIYRPHYKFGRIYLTDNEREHITEKISVTISGTEYKSEEIDRLSDLFDRGMFEINTFGEEPKDDKNKVEIPKGYEGNINSLFDYGLITEYDFDESGEKVSKRAIEYVKYLLDNDLYSFAVTELLRMRDDLDITNSEMFKQTFKDLLYNSMSVLEDKDLIDEQDNI
jgi:hypothetical protein